MVSMPASSSCGERPPSPSHSSTGSPVLLSSLDEPSLPDELSLLELDSSADVPVLGESVVVVGAGLLELDSLLSPVPSALAGSSPAQPTAVVPSTAPMPWSARRRESNPRISSRSFFRNARPLSPQGNAAGARGGSADQARKRLPGGGLEREVLRDDLLATLG